jgi:type II secretory ATPase GspE/PulE/Tfp pilus assembly ATPase PilB-like protein
LVLSTLHTNDAPSSVTRLINIGIEPFLVGAALNGVLAQRLVRRICSNCKVATHPDAVARKRVDVDKHGLEHVWKGEGCDQCRGTGYRGRTGVHELLVMDNDLRIEVQKRRGSEELRDMAISKGMRTLQEDGFRVVRDGLTTLDEVLRVARV